MCPLENVVKWSRICCKHSSWCGRGRINIDDTLFVGSMLLEDTLVEDTLVEDTLVEDTLVEDTLVEDTLSTLDATCGHGGR